MKEAGQAARRAQAATPMGGEEQQQLDELLEAASCLRGTRVVLSDRSRAAWCKEPCILGIGAWVGGMGRLMGALGAWSRPQQRPATRPPPQLLPPAP